MPLRSLVLTQYRSVTDRLMDGRMDGFAVAYTEIAQLALRRAVKITYLRLTDENSRSTACRRQGCQYQAEATYSSYVSSCTQYS